MKLRQLIVVSIALVGLAACRKQAEPTAHSEEMRPYEPYEPATTHEPLARMDTRTEPVVTAADPYATDRMTPTRDPYATGRRQRTAVAPDTRIASDTTTPPPRRPVTTIIPKTDVTGPRTHVVAKGDTLYALARKYYNDQSKWKDIWQANKNGVPNPDKLSIGTELIIP